MPEEPTPGASASSSSGAGPLEVAISLDGTRGCIAQARQAAAHFLAQAREQHQVTVAARAVENTQLIVSELVTNAVKYAPGPGLLQLRISEGTVQVEVWDSDPVLPAALAANPERVGQHGLEIVTILAHSLTMQPTVVGKRITAALHLNPAVSGSAA
ncbi:ATP-binding protein [Streptomyces sp. NPDC050264]|uniref:ATP-binding protein n=1 Tax=Streptomyces sp. NPDC050264 TaxID=3155038 RepID=UPI003446D3DE